MADPAHKLTPPYALNKAVLDVLRTVMDLPELIIALKITMEVDRCPVIECKFHPVKDATHLESTAVESRFAEEPITRRFGLRELS